MGRVLRVGQKYSYSDLDELIVNHVKAMAKKVDELVHNQKFQSGSRQDAEKWLEKYCEANPKRSSYAFCLDPKRPGYFCLLFKAGANAKMGIWVSLTRLFLLADLLTSSLSGLRSSPAPLNLRERRIRMSSCCAM